MRTVTTQSAQIPAIGFGTFGLKGSVAEQSVDFALETGYRHIDTAQIYGNEEAVGAAIRASSVPRQETWLTTKIWFDRFREGDLQRSVEDSVRKLKTEPNLLLLHWPNAKVPLSETMAALNDVKRRGLTDHIGVSNFTADLVGQAVALSAEPLIVNQVEYHPYLSQATVLESVRANDMVVTAYSPLALGKVFADSTLQAIGDGYGKNPGQVALRWLVQQTGVVAIPRSSKKANIRANLEVFDFALTEPEMARISALADPNGRIVNPFPLAPSWDDQGWMQKVRHFVIGVPQAVGRRVRQLYS